MNYPPPLQGAAIYAEGEQHFENYYYYDATDQFSWTAVVVKIVDSTFSLGTGVMGGAIYCKNCKLTLQTSTFTSNKATGVSAHCWSH